MKAADQLSLLVATNQAYAGGDGATALMRKLQAEAAGESGEKARRWRESKPKAAAK